MKKGQISNTAKPVGYVTTDGKWFDVELKKTNIRTFWLKLVGDKGGKVIKVRKDSPKLQYTRKETQNGRKD